MNTDYLKYFSDAYELKSLAKSAQLNNVSRAAVSKAIKNLENKLDLSLIHHKKNQLNFTKDAEMIFDRSLEILNKVSNLSGEKEISNILKLGIVHSLATGRLSDFICNTALDRKVQLFVCNPTEIKNLLSRYIIDFGITIRREEEMNQNEITLHNGTFGLYESSENRNKKQNIYVTPDWPEVVAFKNKIEFIKNYQICVIDSWDVIYSAVKKGKGYGLLPDYFKLKNKKIKKVTRINYDYPYRVSLQHQNSFFDADIISNLKKSLSK